MSEPEIEESYRTAADRLARIWSHLGVAAAEKIEKLQNDVNVNTDSDFKESDEQGEQAGKA